MNLPDPMTVEEGLETLERLGQAVEVAKSALQTWPWRHSDENPQEVWGYPAHMVIGGHFVILDLGRLQKAGLTHQDRITQLESELDKAQKEREQFKNALYMHVEFPSHGEAWEKASQFQKRIKELESELASMREGVQRIYDNPAYAQPWAEGLLKTSSGKALLDRLQAVEKQAKEDKEYIEDLCAQLCKMEDALGFKNDCTDKDGAFVPTIGPWLERVRDLIAAEGELGDVKARLQAVEAERDSLKLELAKFTEIHPQPDRVAPQPAQKEQK